MEDYYFYLQIRKMQHGELSYLFKVRELTTRDPRVQTQAVDPRNCAPNLRLLALRNKRDPKFRVRSVSEKHSLH
jgi:hypothetical protein